MSKLAVQALDELIKKAEVGKKMAATLGDVRGQLLLIGHIKDLKQAKKSCEAYFEHADGPKTSLPTA